MSRYHKKHQPTHTYTDYQSSFISFLQIKNYYNNCFTALWILSGTIRVSWHQEGKTNLDLPEQEKVSGSGISWAVCKSAPRPRQITMPESHRSVFHRLDAHPAAQPTALKH